jgi:hypothetical protein
MDGKSISTMFVTDSFNSLSRFSVKFEEKDMPK